MGDIRVAGLGLDALPHGATGFALTALVQDTLQTAAEIEPDNKEFVGEVCTVVQRAFSADDVRGAGWADVFLGIWRVPRA